ncbi:hypothetical protein [Polaromonas sp. JS666]|uniref:hypothetical protein n=1 Tax=Polaromonas sp. (strain JS666 / ATCC BAA-500) TaxID=296591 RepID=UPI000326376E|nr:hypothetical protein [Polaromonas sp. JS666]
MPRLFFLRSRSSRANALALALAIAPAVLSFGANAASATGAVSATVIGEMISLPIVIRLQTPQASVQAMPIRLGFTIDQPTRARAAPGGVGSTGEGSVGASFGITLVDVDAAGVARFSVAGADATSGYMIQFPTSRDSLIAQNSLVVASRQPGLSSSGAQGFSANDSAASLIVPAQSLLSGGRLAVEVSQALTKLLSGELSVQVNYN